MPYCKSNIEESVYFEILRAEQTRALILGFISLIVSIFTAVVFISLPDTVAEIVDIKAVRFIVVGILFLFSFREFGAYIILKKMLELKKHYPIELRYLGYLFEVSIPTLIIWLVSFEVDNAVVLFTPITYFYFIIIILSTLSLDWRLCLFTGIMASLQLGITSYFLLDIFRFDAGMEFFADSVTHYGKNILLLCAGFSAGFVTRQLRKRIINSFKMADERAKVVNMFGQQVSPEIVDYMMNSDDEDKSQHKFVCVMFLDIRGFTPFTENKSPEEVIQYQNKVFGFMIDIIIEHYGIINQFLGDGYMATFGAPISKGNDSQNAFSAAVKIINEVNRRSETGEIPNTKIGIGLHSGDVVAGNVGTEKRKQYSISGSTVVIAARLEGLNKTYNSCLLISEEVFNNIEYNGTYEKIGPVEIKGREKPINVFKMA